MVLDSIQAAIIEVDLVTGQRTVFSAEGRRGNGPGFSNPLGIAIDSTHAFVVNQGTGVLLRVDLTTGDREPVSDATSTGPSFVSPESITLRGNNQALVTDSGLSAIVSVNLTDGTRDLLQINGSISLQQPKYIAVEQAGIKAYIVDTGLKALLELDIGTGTLLKLVSIDSPQSLVLDEENRRILIPDDTSNGLILFDLDIRQSVFIQPTVN